MYYDLDDLCNTFEHFRPLQLVVCTYETHPELALAGNTVI